MARKKQNRQGQSGLQKMENASSAPAAQEVVWGLMPAARNMGLEALEEAREEADQFLRTLRKVSAKYEAHKNINGTLLRRVQELREERDAAVTCLEHGGYQRSADGKIWVPPVNKYAAKYFQVEKERNQAREALRVLHTLRPRSEYHEDYGVVLWHRVPICEPPIVDGHDLDEIDESYTHWSPIPMNPEIATPSHD